jgi:hypothetical protein
VHSILPSDSANKYAAYRYELARFHIFLSVGSVSCENTFGKQKYGFSKSLVDESYKGVVKVTANARHSLEPEMEMDVTRL